MICSPDTKKEDIPKLLRKHEKEELLDYCKEQGYTEEETKIFIENSLASLYHEYLGE